MVKKTVYTQITPLPSHIPRQLAIDLLHNHGEIIELSPLVIEHHPIKAPRDAPSDEYYAAWHEITQRIQYFPGFGKMGSGKISFRGVFHDLPYGLQSHTYVPLGVDLRNRYEIKGNQPGEPPEARELGSKAPAEGLYLKEDVEIKCNMMAMHFVKNQMKEASKVLIERLVRKAELLDAGVLHAMFEDGKLKAVNPALRNQLQQAAGRVASPGINPPQSPNLALPPQSPRMMSPDMRRQSQWSNGTAPTEYNNTTEPVPYHILRQQEEERRRMTYDPYRNQTFSDAKVQYRPAFPQPPQQGLAIEMPGDYYHPNQQLNNQANLHPAYRYSTFSELPNTSPSNPSFRDTSDAQSSVGSDISRPMSYARPPANSNSPSKVEELPVTTERLPENQSTTS